MKSKKVKQLKGKFIRQYDCPICECNISLVNKTAKITGTSNNMSLDAYVFEEGTIKIDACPNCGNIYMIEFRKDYEEQKTIAG